MKLRPYQTAAVEALWSYFEAGGAGHPLIVMPTGAGKSLVIAEIVRQVLDRWPTSRVLMLAHVKELIEQNLDKLMRVWPSAPVGVFSAGLRQFNTDAPILFCGIQSVWNKAAKLADVRRPVELILIDEAHRVPIHQEGTYRKFVADLTAINPHLRLIGLTATPYRHVPATQTHSGGYAALTYGRDRLFTDVCYDSSKDLVGLIHQDYLAALWPEPTTYRVDLSGIDARNGDYREDQLNQLLARDEVLDALLSEAVALARADGRRHWLVYCAGVGQAERAAAWLRSRGIPTGLVTGDMPSGARRANIAVFREGKSTALVSVGVLTTGFDAPDADCLIVARPTLSPVLHVQIMGRGMRPTPEKIAVIEGKKRGCLVLDFVGNVERHGPIDRIQIKTPGPKKPEPMKTCPKCRADIRARDNPCPNCGYEFPPAERDSPAVPPRANKHAIIDGLQPPVVARHAVTRTAYGRHLGKSGIPTLRVDYFNGFLRAASEWICLEHEGYAGQKAEKWWRARAAAPASDVASALAVLAGIGIAEPSAIHVRQAPGGFSEIVKYEWPDRGVRERAVGEAA